MNLSESVMWREIHEQPEVIKASLNANQPALKAIAEEAKAKNIRRIVFVARGSSEHACFVARYVGEIYTDLNLSIALPSVITAYNGKVDYRDALVVGVSQSGGAKDVLKVLETAKDQGALTLSLTNVEGSPLSKVAHYNLNNACGPELSVTATKSFLTQMILMIALIAEMSGEGKLSDFLEKAPDSAKKALDLADDLAQHVPMFAKAEHMLLFGRGLLFATGLESELKIQETCNLDARCYASSDYRHGPIVTASPKTPALFFIADRATDYCPAGLLDDLVKRGVDCLALTDDKTIAQSHKSVYFEVGNDHLQNLIVCSVVSQMLACMMSIARGYNPDKPEGVTKNTVTY